MPVLRSLLTAAVRRAAADPRVRAKAAELYESEVRPRAAQAARQGRGALEQVRSDWRDVAEQTRPLDNPGLFAGRLVGRLRNRLREGDEE